MPVEVILPKVDMDMESGQISRWYAKDGDSVTKGQLLFEIETDKAAMEVDAPSSGILRDVKAQEGATVPVGQAVAWIYAEGEVYNAAASPVEDEAKALPPKDEPVSVSQSVAAAPVNATPDPVENNDVRATPLARRIAREARIDLASVSGSGPKGRIQKKDVERRTSGDVGTAVAVPGSPADPAGALLHAVWLREGSDSGLAPLVLIHGFGSDLNSWRPMLGGGRLDNPVLAIDLPGHGASTHAVPDSLDAIAGQVEQTIAAYHTGPVLLVGHSFGGAIATEIAGRGNADVRALVLIAPAGLGPEINGAFLSGFVRARSEESLVAWMKQLVQDESLLSKPFVNATLAQSRDVPLRDAQKLVSDRFFPDGTQVFSIRRSLDSLTIPVRVVFGSADQVIPAGQAAGLPGQIAVHIFARTGHMPQLEQREKIMTILSEVSRSAR